MELEPEHLEGVRSIFVNTELQPMHALNLAQLQRLTWMIRFVCDPCPSILVHHVQGRLTMPNADASPRDPFGSASSRSQPEWGTDTA